MQLANEMVAGGAEEEGEEEDGDEEGEEEQESEESHKKSRKKASKNQAKKGQQPKSQVVSKGKNLKKVEHEQMVEGFSAESIQERRKRRFERSFEQIEKLKRLEEQDMKKPIAKIEVVPKLIAKPVNLKLLTRKQPFLHHRKRALNHLQSKRRR